VPRAAIVSTSRARVPDEARVSDTAFRDARLRLQRHRAPENPENLENPENPENPENLENPANPCHLSSSIR
jgi:hypothetical protein